MSEVRVLRGTIVTGIGDYAQWITKYHDYYQAKTGLSLFPGTLNLRLDHPYELPSAKVIRLEGHEYDSRVSVSILPVRLFGRPGAIPRPDLLAWATAADAEGRLSTLEWRPISNYGMGIVNLTGCRRSSLTRFPTLVRTKCNQILKLTIPVPKDQLPFRLLSHGANRLCREPPYGLPETFRPAVEHSTSPTLKLMLWIFE